MRPDIMIITDLTTHDSPEAGTKYRIHIMEIGYCSDTNHNIKLRAKQQQHATLIDHLRLAGHTVFSHVITLGTTGTIPLTLPKVLEELGVDRPSRDHVIAKLHKHATHCANGIISMRRHREWAGTPA